MMIYPALALALTVFAAPLAAQEVAIGHDRYAITLPRADLYPATPAAARRALERIDRAAMAVCGASDVSLRELRLAVRRSACWRDSIAELRSRIDDPLLLQAWSRRFPA